MELDNLKRNYKRCSMDKMLNLLKGSTERYMVREGSECNELIFDGNHNVYASPNKNFPNDKICLFRMVSTNVKKYLASEPFILLPPKKDVSYFNFNYDHKRGKLTGTDLDHAYWRIAYAKGYITKKTYLFGLDERCKPLRLATLSVLGREKVYDLYEGDKLIEKVVYKQKDEQMRMVYHDIRYSCFYMMYELSEMLGDDFDCWKTGCIYYRDTPANRKMVQNYFEEREMLFKQLVFDESKVAPEQEY